MNLAEGYLGRAPPDIVRSVMPTSFSSRSLYSGKDGTQVGPYEDNRMQHEKHRNGVGGTWPRQMQGPSHAKYPDSPLDNSSTFHHSNVLPSPRSRSSRFLSQSVESPLWSDGPPNSARDPFASAVPTITIQDFSAVPTPGFSQNTRYYHSGEREPRSFDSTFGAGTQNNKDYLRSPRMNDRRYGTFPQGPFYTITYDNPQSRNNTGGTGWGSETVHHIAKGTGTAAETGTGECYARVTQQLMRDSEMFAVDRLQPAISQTRYTPEPRASNETNRSGKALLAFQLPGHGSSSAEENSRNPDNFGYASANKIQHLWRNHINPIGRVDLSGSGDSRGFNRSPTDGYSSESCLAARLADNTSRELCSDGTHLDTNAGGRTGQPQSHNSQYRNFLGDRSFSSDHSFSQDRSFSDDGPFSDLKGTSSGKKTLLSGGGAQLEDHLHRWMTPLDDTATFEPVKGQEMGGQFIKEILSTKYDSRRRGNGRPEDLISSGGFAETPVEGTKTAIECGKAMMGQHRKWIQMEERLLSRVYELQKERSHLVSKVEELTSENQDLSRKFKDTAEQLETKELEMENVRHQLREKIVDMTSTVYSTSQVVDSTPPSSRRDAFSSNTSSNQQRCHDDDVDGRRGRQMAQEELAACQIRFARERERWISEKIKVLRYQQLLQAKYEQVVTENKLLKEQVGKGFCENATPIRSTMTQQRLTLLKDGPSGRSFDSIC